MTTSSSLERLWARHVSRPAEVLAEAKAELGDGARTDAERADVLAVLLRAVDAVLAHFVAGSAGDVVAGNRRPWWQQRATELVAATDDLRQRGVTSDFIERRLAERRRALAFPEPAALVAEQERRLERDDERALAARAAAGDLVDVLEALASAGAEPSPAMVELASAHALGALRAAAFGRQADAGAVLGLTRAYALLVARWWLPFLLGEEVVATALLFSYRHRAPAVAEVALGLTPFEVTTASLAFQLARAHAARRERGAFLRFLERACALDRDSLELEGPELGPYQTDADYRRILAAHPPTVEIFEPDYDDGS